MSIKSAGDLRFEYNEKATAKTITLDGTYADINNTSHSGTITIAPYSSVILIRNGAAVAK